MVVERARRLVAGHMPTRESIARNRWLRPVAHLVLRGELWRFTRRSVPRGVALGIFVGFAIPFMHSVIAPALAFLVNANVPTTFAATLLSNPVTWAVLWPLALRIGDVMLHSGMVSEPGAFADPAVRADADAVTVPGSPGIDQMAAHGAEMAHHHGHMLHRLVHGGLAFACGLVVEATVLAVVGYAVTSVVWRILVLRRRRQRLSRAAGARAAA